MASEGQSSSVPTAFVEATTEAMHPTAQADSCQTFRGSLGLELGSSLLLMAAGE